MTATDLAAAMPSFLKRPLAKETPPMTTPVPAPTAAKPPKKRKTDCYTARVLIQIPLDMANADSLANAIKAVAKMKEHLPDGASFDVAGTLGKV